MYQLIISWGQESHDYSRYVKWDTVSISEAINIPTTCKFSMFPVDRGFVVPPQRAYVQIYSTQFDKSLFTGFIIQEPVRNYLAPKPGEPPDGLRNSIGQWFEYVISCTSDEYLLNIKAIPFIPAYINRTQGQILSDIAENLCPGFFDTSGIMDGDIVPYFSYTSKQSWSEIAKDFGDGTRFRYHVRDKKIWYVPYGDLPCGIQYDEINDTTKLFSPKDLQTTVLSVPVVNDVTIVGDTEAGNNREDYFIGDGFTANFPLEHQVFRGASSMLLQEQWTEGYFNSQQWNLLDSGQDGAGGPGSNFDFSAGAVNIVTKITPPYPPYQFQLGQSYLAMNNGIELAGGIDLEAGECMFNDVCEGHIGSLHTGSGEYVGGLTTQYGANSLLGSFYIHTPPSGVVNGASGAGGISIQPWWAGLNATDGVNVAGAQNVNGVQVVTKVNHSYVLQMVITAPVYSRYTKLYRTLGGEQYGGGSPTCVGSVTWNIQDYDITASSGFYYVPEITSVTLTNVTLPSFVAYCLCNNEQLNLTLGSGASGPGTTISLMPLGALWCNIGPLGLAPPVVANTLTTAGATLPLLPPGSGGYIGGVSEWPGNTAGIAGGLYVQGATGSILQPPGLRQGWQQQVMGYGLQLQVAQVTQGNEADTLGFYAQTAPAAGTPIRFQSWEAQAAVSRLQNPASISTEAYVVGDDGIRSAIVTDLNPLPRTSEDCDNAALAFLADRGSTFYNGTYTVTSHPVKAPYFRGLTSDEQFYPTCGRFLSVNAPRRGISGQSYLITQLTTQILAEVEEVTQWQIQFGADLYLEKALKNFVDLLPKDVLEPSDKANPPVPRALADVSTSYLPDMANVMATNITDTTVTITQSDEVAPYVIEVRTSDVNWGMVTTDRVGVFTGASWVLQRSAFTDTWFMRCVANNVLLLGTLSLTNGSYTATWVSGESFNPPTTPAYFDPSWGYGEYGNKGGAPIFYVLVPSPLQVLRVAVVSATPTTLSLQQPWSGSTGTFTYSVVQVITSRRSKVIRVSYPQTPAKPVVFAVTPGTFDGKGGQVQFAYNGDVRSIYGLELRTKDDSVVLWQQPALTFANMNVDLSNNTPYDGLDKSLQDYIKAYFFNLQWSYSDPCIVVPIPYTSLQTTTVLGPWTFDPTLSYTLVEIDTTNGSFQLQLCDQSLLTVDVTFKKISTDSNTCTLLPIAGQTIEDQASWTLTYPGDAITFSGAGQPGNPLSITECDYRVSGYPQPILFIFVTAIGESQAGMNVTVAGSSVSAFNQTYTIAHVQEGNGSEPGFLQINNITIAVADGTYGTGGTATLG